MPRPAPSAPLPASRSSTTSLTSPSPSIPSTRSSTARIPAPAGARPPRPALRGLSLSPDSSALTRLAAPETGGCWSLGLTAYLPLPLRVACWLGRLPRRKGSNLINLKR